MKRLLTSLRAHEAFSDIVTRAWWSRGNVGECWRLLLKSEQNPLTRSINEIYGTHPTREALSRICGYDIGAPVNSNDRGITKGYIVTRSRMTHKGRELLQGKHSTRGAGGHSVQPREPQRVQDRNRGRESKRRHLHNDSAAAEELRTEPGEADPKGKTRWTSTGQWEYFSRNSCPS